MSYRFLASLGALAVVIAIVSVAPVPVAGQAPSSAAKAPKTAAAKTWTPPRTPDGHPDLQGVWSFATITPMERPSELAGKQVLTDQEAAEFEQQAFQRNNADRRDGGADADVSRAYDEALDRSDSHDEDSGSDLRVLVSRGELRHVGTPRRSSRRGEGRRSSR